MSHHLLTEKTKHITDVIAVGAGSTATISHWLAEIINPVLTAMISIATLIWLWYRIKELRQKIIKD